jgi:hypothetical protein
MPLVKFTRRYRLSILSNPWRHPLVRYCWGNPLTPSPPRRCTIVTPLSRHSPPRHPLAVTPAAALLYYTIVAVVLVYVVGFSIVLKKGYQAGPLYTVPFSPQLAAALSVKPLSYTRSLCLETPKVL